MFNARSILDGISLSNKNSIGEKLSTEALNIYDDGLHEKNISSSPFDGEGTPTKRLCLINKGDLKILYILNQLQEYLKQSPLATPDWDQKSQYLLIG